MAMKSVDPSAVSNNSVLDLLTVSYIQYYRFAYAATEIDKDRHTLIEQSGLYVLFNMAVTNSTS